MVEQQTLSNLLERLEQDGYTDDLKAEEDGSMRVFPRDVTVAPQDLTVLEVYRFEGDTNLDDEEAVFVVSCEKMGIKGTYIVAFGPNMDPIDTAMVHRLQNILVTKVY